MQSPERGADVTVERFRWGIFGTGAVSLKFGAALRHIGSHVTMVASRTEAGRPLANAFGCELVTGYRNAAAFAHGRVDAIYIATPPACHKEHALACLEAGIPVLIEKPMGAFPDDVIAICRAARERKTFVMEGMWTRFIPAVARLRRLIDSGVIGEPRMMSADFSQNYIVDPEFGNFDPSRGGGALAHLGYYPLSLGQWLFGEVEAAQAVGRVGSTGVEEDVSISLRYASGVTGSFRASLRASGENRMVIYGTHGHVELEGPIYRPWGVRVEVSAPRIRSGSQPSRKALFRETHLWNRLGQWRQRLGRPGVRRVVPFAGNGYQYEAQEVERCVREKLLESPVMPLIESQSLAMLVNRLRSQIREDAES